MAPRTSSGITRAAQHNLSVPMCAATNTQALASHGALDPARALLTVAGAHQPAGSRPMITVAATHMHSKLVDPTRLASTRVQGRGRIAHESLRDSRPSTPA